MPTNTPTIPADAQRVLTDLKANILDAADDALLDAYAVGRDAGLTEQQAKLDTVVAERARTTNHLYGLLQTKDGELVRARELAAARRCDLAHYAERIAELEATDARNRERIAELDHDLRASQAMANDLDDKHSAAMWDLAALRTRVAELEHDLRVSESNHATDRERLDTEIRNHQKTRAAMVAARENLPARPGVGIGGKRPPNRIGEVVYVFGTSTEGGVYARIAGDSWANIRRIRALHPWDIAAVEFPAGHIVWASSPAVLGDVRRLFHSK